MKTPCYLDSGPDRERDRRGQQEPRPPVPEEAAGNKCIALSVWSTGLRLRPEIRYQASRSMVFCNNWQAKFACTSWVWPVAHMMRDKIAP